MFSQLAMTFAGHKYHNTNWFHLAKRSLPQASDSEFQVPTNFRNPIVWELPALLHFSYLWDGYVNSLHCYSGFHASTSKWNLFLRIASKILSTASVNIWQHVYLFCFLSFVVTWTFEHFFCTFHAFQLDI